jgi:hypothetical protein
VHIDDRNEAILNQSPRHAQSVDFGSTYVIHRSRPVVVERRSGCDDPARSGALGEMSWSASCSQTDCISLTDPGGADMGKNTHSGTHIRSSRTFGWLKGSALRCGGHKPHSVL